MNNPLLLVAAASTLLLAGCGKGQPDPVRELERAAEVMAAEPAPPPPAIPQTPQYSAAPVPVPPAQQMNQALAAYKNGELEDAVTQLQKLRAQPAMSPQQRMALQDAMAAVMVDIYTRAANGDARAQRAVKEYERLQTSQ